MSEKNITPGPWSLANDVVGKRNEIGFTRHIAEALWDDEQGKADMALIAAAPDLYEAAKQWQRWDYEVMSAKVSGESIYSFNDLAAMRERARFLTDSALARVGAKS